MRVFAINKIATGPRIYLSVNIFYKIWSNQQKKATLRRLFYQVRFKKRLTHHSDLFTLAALEGVQGQSTIFNVAFGIKGNVACHAFEIGRLG